MNIGGILKLCILMRPPGTETWQTALRPQKILKDFRAESQKMRTLFMKLFRKKMQYGKSLNMPTFMLP